MSLGLLAAGTSETVVGGRSGLLTTQLINDGESSPKLEVVKRDMGADELVSAGRRWLVVPVLLATDLQGFEADPAVALALECVLMDLLEVPLGASLSFELGQHLLVLWVVRDSEIVEFLGVVDEVEQLRRIDQRAGVLPLVTTDHVCWGDGALSHVFTEDLILARLVRDQIVIPSMGRMADASPPARSTKVGRRSIVDTDSVTRFGLNLDG
jgi:hypothetical protein